MEILVKMRTQSLSNKINYADFSGWVGKDIEPTENFFFRHDSKKNPQFEVNLVKMVEKHAPNEKKVNQ
jgi:hypothetical protein